MLTICRPIWYQNFKFLYGGSYEERLAVAWMFLSMVERWIDDNMVKGNSDNEALVRELLSTYTEIADWRVSKNKDKNERIERLRHFCLRLEGLVRC
jgi:hypothetical protein